MKARHIVAVLVLASATAHADGALTMRGVYYKERSTRVIQPMLDGAFEVGMRGLLTAHLLVDAITSASATPIASTDTAFTEKRYEAGAGYTQEFDGPDNSILDVYRLGGDAKVSHEPDYDALYVGVRGEAELAQKNATVAVGGGFSHDSVGTNVPSGGLGGGLLLQCKGDDVAQSTSCPLDTYNAFGSLSHLLSKNALVGVSYDLAHNNGYLASPYRQVIIAPTPVAERHPFDRTRHAVSASARLYVPQTKTAFIGAYRYYWDSWNVHAHTPELRLIQDVGTGIDASFRYRYYKQDAAFFWKAHYMDAMETYVTDDPKMSPFDGHLLEAKLGVLGEVFDLSGRWAGARFEGILEYIVQHNRFGNAVVAHAALTLPFDY